MCPAISRTYLTMQVTMQLKASVKSNYQIAFKYLSASNISNDRDINQCYLFSNITELLWRHTIHVCLL